MNATAVYTNEHPAGALLQVGAPLLAWQISVQQVALSFFPALVRSTRLGSHASAQSEVFSFSILGGMLSTGLTLMAGKDASLIVGCANLMGMLAAVTEKAITAFPPHELPIVTKAFTMIGVVEGITSGCLIAKMANYQLKEVVLMDAATEGIAIAAAMIYGGRKMPMCAFLLTSFIASVLAQSILKGVHDGG